MALADLFVEDDLNISVDPETYEDQSNPAPPAPGTYSVVVLGKLRQKTEKDGQPVLTDGKYPIFTIDRVKIVEPADSEREFGLFADVRTKPFERRGTVVSDVGDIVRAMDQTRKCSGMAEGVGALEEGVDTNTPFKVQLEWEAFDSKFCQEEFAKLGIDSTQRGASKKAIDAGLITKEVSNAIYKKARLGTKAFPVIEKNGQLVRQGWTYGPSGEKLDARIRVQRYIPSLDDAVLGPAKLKAN
jgi:hypothetical protein